MQFSKLNIEIFFCGLSKNNFNSLKKNIDFIFYYEKKTIFNNINLLIVDSNSEDGSKEYLNNISKSNKFVDIIHKDDLNLVTSRIERIKICRNLCLNYIQQNSDNNIRIYIPLDTDFFLFSNTSVDQLDALISKVLKTNKSSAIFPVSSPYYYDIFALRAQGWLNINSQLIVSRLKKYLKVGSFLFNYLFIFRYQLSPEKIKQKKFKLKSAFGGIGIYNLSDINLKHQKYETNEKSKEWYSEHIYFNQHFDDLMIEPNWIVDAPKEHVMFKSKEPKDKFIYFLKTIKEDVNTLFMK